MRIVSIATMVTMVVSAGPDDPPPSAPIGGYWGLGERPEVAPKDGEDELLAGAILFPIGFVTVATAAAMMAVTAPQHCEEQTARLGYDLNADQCRSLFIFSAVRTGYGAAELIAGLTLLGVGIHRRRKLAAWKRERFRTAIRIAPSWSSTGGGLMIRGRF